MSFRLQHDCGHIDLGIRGQKEKAVTQASPAFVVTRLPATRPLRVPWLSNTGWLGDRRHGWASVLYALTVAF